jgi:hypothetical protein
MHVDSEGTIDWAGVTDPTLRVLPDDPAGAGVVRLPGETALATWVAHRCHRSLEPVFSELERLSRGALGRASMWQTVGAAVVVTATQVPLLNGASELVCMRRGPGGPRRADVLWPAGSSTAPESCGLQRLPVPPEGGPRVSPAGSVPVNTDACNQSSR